MSTLMRDAIQKREEDLESLERQQREALTKINKIKTETRVLKDVMVRAEEISNLTESLHGLEIKPAMPVSSLQEEVERGERIIITVAKRISGLIEKYRANPRNGRVAGHFKRTSAEVTAAIIGKLRMSPKEPLTAGTIAKTTGLAPAVAFHKMKKLTAQGKIIAIKGIGKNGKECTRFVIAEE